MHPELYHIMKVFHEHPPPPLHIKNFKEVGVVRFSNLQMLPVK